MSLLNDIDNYIVCDIDYRINDIIDSDYKYITISIDSTNDNNKIIIYDLIKRKWNLFDKNEKVKIKRNYNFMKSFILYLLPKDDDYENKHIIVKIKKEFNDSYEIFYDLYINEIVHHQKIAKLDKYFRVCEDGLEITSCDDENKKHNRQLYKNISKFVDDIELLNIEDEYFYFCDKTNISGKMFEIKVKYHEQNLILYHLENQYDYCDDKGCVADGGVMLFKIDNNNDNNNINIVSKISVRCGHQTIFYKEYGGWSYSHGEYEFPNVDPTNLNSFKKSLKKIIKCLARY